MQPKEQGGKFSQRGSTKGPAPGLPQHAAAPIQFRFVDLQIPRELRLACDKATRQCSRTAHTVEGGGETADASGQDRQTQVFPTHLDARACTVVGHHPCVVAVGMPQSGVSLKARLFTWKSAQVSSMNR